MPEPFLVGFTQSPSEVASGSSSHAALALREANRMMGSSGFLVDMSSPARLLIRRARTSVEAHARVAWPVHRWLAQKGHAETTLGWEPSPFALSVTHRLPRSGVHEDSGPSLDDDCWQRARRPSKARLSRTGRSSCRQSRSGDGGLRTDATFGVYLRQKRKGGGTSRFTGPPTTPGARSD